jgi:hypothetical protein
MSGIIYFVGIKSPLLGLAYLVQYDTLLDRAVIVLLKLITEGFHGDVILTKSVIGASTNFMCDIVAAQDSVLPLSPDSWVSAVSPVLGTKLFGERLVLGGLLLVLYIHLHGGKKSLLTLYKNFTPVFAELRVAETHREVGGHEINAPSALTEHTVRVLIGLEEVGLMTSAT